MIPTLRATICLYIVVYYILNLVLVQLGKNGFCNSTTPVAEVETNTSNITSETIIFDIRELSLYELTSFFEGPSFAAFLKEWKNAEKGILVSFFLGFYVSFLLARWWQQVSTIPKLDKLLSIIHANIAFSRSGEEDDNTTKQEKAIKCRIARYCLLGIMLRVSALSDHVRSQFASIEDYINKGLITPDEYYALREPGSFTKMSVDGLASRWFLPLNWAAMLARDAGMSTNKKLLAEHKGIVKEIAGIQKSMIRITQFFHYHMNPTMQQTIVLAVIVYFGCGLLASQGTTTCENILKDYGNSGTIAGAIFSAFTYNFPFFQVIKYILVLTWFYVAKMVARPFGHDRYLKFQLLLVT